MTICGELSDEEWGLGRFDHRCYFYPGRDCPGWEASRPCGRIGNIVPEQGEAMAESADPYRTMRPPPESRHLETCPLTISIDGLQMRATAILDSNEVMVYLEEDDRSRTLQALVANRVIVGLKITPILQKEAIRAGTDASTQEH